MDDWQIVLLTGCVSVAVSIVTACITISLTHRNEVKKIILEKRTELYFEVYSFIEKLLNEESKIYDDDYIESLLKFKPKMKLLASVGTMEEFKSLFEIIMTHYNDYMDFCDHNSPYNNPGAIKTEIENDEEYEIVNVTNIDLAYYEDAKKLYRENNLLGYENISQYTNALYEKMRVDLGSNMK